MAAAQETPEDISRQKWWRLPSALTVDLAQVRSLNTYKLVLFIARQTFGWGVRSAIMSYDELRHGRYYAPGKRMKDVSGLRNDQAIADAMRDALERGLIEVQQTTAGVAYRIPDRYWSEAGLVPEQGEFWRYTPRWVGYTNGSAQENRAGTATETGNTNGSAQHCLAQQQENLSTSIGIPEHSSKKTLAQPLYERAPHVAPSVPLDTSLDTSLDTGDRYVGPSATLQPPMSRSQANREEDEPTQVGAPTQKVGGNRSADDTGTQDIDALAQRLADQQVLQSLLAEQQHLQALRPGERGWGAAQQRLRAIAPEIARLQALAARQAEAMSDPERAPTSLDATRAEERGSPAAHQPMRRVGSPAGGDLADPEQITRRQRLMQLQGELAHLKKTPSMQLLARQRIPRLETEIKQLIAELQASA